MNVLLTDYSSITHAESWFNPTQQKEPETHPVTRYTTDYL